MIPIVHNVVTEARRVLMQHRVFIADMFCPKEKKRSKRDIERMTMKRKNKNEDQEQERRD